MTVLSVRFYPLDWAAAERCSHQARQNPSLRPAPRALRQNAQFYYETGPIGRPATSDSAKQTVRTTPWPDTPGRPKYFSW
jgi:hypothetical protein